MKKRPNKLSEEELAEFREAVGEIKRLKTDRLHLRQKRPKPIAYQEQRDRLAVLEESLQRPENSLELETGDELFWARDGVQTRVLRRLKRGYYSIEDEIDLHALARDAAKTVLLEFLERANRRGLGCVKVIHGKGLRSSPKGPVLKGMVDNTLRRRSDVLAYASAPLRDGGTGVVYVLLRRRAQGTR